MHEPDVIVVGAGLAGLVATHELAEAGRRVLVVDQENRNNIGGQAFWSLAGLFFVDSPEQRRAGVKDSYELALADWMGSAGFDRDDEDHWPRQWAEAYVRFAATEKRQYLRDLGLRVLPMPGWAERGDGRAGGHGNSVPRFHMTWGVGPELGARLSGAGRGRRAARLVEFAFRHQVDELRRGGRRGRRRPRQPPRAVRRARAWHRLSAHGGRGLRAAGEGRRRSSGGLGHNFDAIRENWPVGRMGEPPAHMIAGVPAHVDGRMLGISEDAGASIVNRDRMWHYPEGVHNWNSIWPHHAIRIISGPSPMWLDANGERLETPFFPGFDALGTFKRILSTGHDYSWLILNETIIAKEFALSGSEQNPDVAGKGILTFLRSRLSKRPTGPVEAFKNNGMDFVIATTCTTSSPG